MGLAEGPSPGEVGRVVERLKVAFATGEPWEDTFPLRSKTGDTDGFFLALSQSEMPKVGWFDGSEQTP
jgi:hypothetical protein